MESNQRIFYTSDQVKLITDAYRHVFGPIGGDLREYWDLDRKREWGCLTSDFQVATFDQYAEASKLAIQVEATVFDPVQRGHALREVTRQTKVGLSLGPCPWTDHGLFQTYEQNKRKGRLTIILGHDWYPIVPARAKTPHPVDVPLSRYAGLRGLTKYINVGAVPASIMDKSEMLIFLNFKPDFRPPNSPTVGPFEPYARCSEGFNALVDAVSRNFKVQIISWGANVWELLRKQVAGLQKPLGICVHARSPEGFGRPLELICGHRTIPYLPLAHPCDRRNFNEQHAAHAKEGFLKMGLGGTGKVSPL
jgi:hypothetical protein